MQLSQEAKYSYFVLDAKLSGKRNNKERRKNALTVGLRYAQQSIFLGNETLKRK